LHCSQQQKPQNIDRAIHFEVIGVISNWQRRFRFAGKTSETVSSPTFAKAISHDFKMTMFSFDLHYVEITATALSDTYNSCVFVPEFNK
jgi:hypothetical protein